MISYRISDCDGIQETIEDYGRVLYNTQLLVLVNYKKPINNGGYEGIVPEEETWYNT